jgi:hypothetical protein
LDQKTHFLVADNAFSWSDRSEYWRTYRPGKKKGPPKKYNFRKPLIICGHGARIGAIARSKQIVVVGDDRQLPPTNFFNRIAEDKEIAEQEEEDYDLGDLESILSLGNIILPNQTMLRWHYRSHHPGLISVSNRNFYDNKLLIPPSNLRGSFADGLGVSFVASPSNSYERGGSSGGRNVVEADMIAQEVIKFARTTPEKSVGVAAFSVTQRDATRYVRPQSVPTRSAQWVVSCNIV